MLNTQFLSVILKGLRGAAASSSAGTSMSSASSASSGSSGVLTVRITAAAALSMAIRYATSIRPPTMKNKDDHIITSLLFVLKDSLPSTKNEASSSSYGHAASTASVSSKNSALATALKRRCVAALGELYFYVSGQDDDDEEDSGRPSSGSGSASALGAVADATATDNSSRDSGKWTMPPAALTMLARALRDDNDETTRFYAAKVIVSEPIHVFIHTIITSCTVFIPLSGY